MGAVLTRQMKTMLANVSHSEDSHRGEASTATLFYALVPGYTLQAASALWALYCYPGQAKR